MRKPGRDGTRNLIFATIAFVVSFAVWGLLSGLAPLLQADLGLSATATSVMIAVPVLLGALGRLPMGFLTDWYGGRLVFSALLVFAVVPAAALAVDHSYASLLFWGFWLGMAGTSFAIGVAFVSRWYPPERQGFGLGVFGAGNVGQSIAVFLAPVLASTIGIPGTFLTFGLASGAWGLVFALMARDAPGAFPARSLQDNLRVLRARPLSWALSLFYFLTFGGFVALGVSLPVLLTTIFDLGPGDAGARTAGFIILATASRPLGGWLADQIGGHRMLFLVFVGIVLLGWLMAVPSIYPFTVGALGCGFLMGLGSGAVFKLVPQYFPAQVGTVTGLVGATGGLGGFFPPLVLGVLKDATGTYALGFVFLSLFAFGCLAVLWAVLLRTPRAGRVEPHLGVDVETS